MEGKNISDVITIATEDGTLTNVSIDIERYAFLNKQIRIAGFAEMDVIVDRLMSTILTVCCIAFAIKVYKLLTETPAQRIRRLYREYDVANS